jgi:hypothetical protein
MTWAKGIKEFLWDKCETHFSPFFTESLIPRSILLQILWNKRPQVQKNSPDFSVILHQFIS